MSIPARHRVRDVFCTASHRTTTTSPKLLTDKLDHKQTSHKDKQTSWEHVPDQYQHGSNTTGGLEKRPSANMSRRSANPF